MQGRHSTLLRPFQLHGSSPELAFEGVHLTAHGLVALSGFIQLPLQLSAVGIDALGLLLCLFQLPLELLDLGVSFLCLPRKGQLVSKGQCVGPEALGEARIVRTRDQLWLPAPCTALPSCAHPPPAGGPPSASCPFA